MIDMRDDRDVTNVHAISGNERGARAGAPRYNCGAHSAFFAIAKGGGLPLCLDKIFSGGRELCSTTAHYVTMKPVTSHSAFVAATILAMAVLSLAVALSSVDARDSQTSSKAGKSIEAQQTNEATSAEQAYPDAPDGVDPITTGPVSEAFREQQRIAGCREAKWPDIPIICYPS